MSTAEALKSLPGLDSAPDVYATPDPFDDATESSRNISPSPSGGRRRASGSDTSHEDDDSDDDSESYGVSRRRLYPERARIRFDAQSRGVDARGVDLSDRVDGKRKGYRVKRNRRGSNEGQELETLEAKIARLKREVEECRQEAQAEDQTAQEGENGDGGGSRDAIESLSRMMSGLDMPPAKRKGHARNRSAYHDAPTIPSSSTADQENDQQQQSISSEQTLTNITSFDSRLAAIESALGLSSLDATTELSALTSPLLPTIALLDHQVATLTSATSLSALEAASTRIHKLKSEAAELSNLQFQHPPPAQQQQSSTTTSDTEDDASDSETPPPTITTALLSSEDLKSLRTLYTLLPTLQSLLPTLPPLTTRLRSLRTIHTAASSAHADLDALEQRQEEMASELKMWRQGLEKVEEAVENAEEMNAANGKFVRGWVEDLEGRVGELRR